MLCQNKKNKRNGPWLYPKDYKNRQSAGKPRIEESSETIEKYKIY